MADAAVDDFVVESNRPVAAEPPPNEPPAPAEPPPATPPDPSPDGVAEPAGTGDDAAEEPDPAASADASEAGRQLAKKKRSLQDALKQETWEKHEARRQAAELQARLAELEGKKAEPPKGKQPIQVDPNDPPPSVEQFETYEEFVDERAAWRARQEYRALRERDEHEAAGRAYQTRLSELEQKGTEKHADFVPALEQLAASGRKFNPFVTGIIQNHELGHDIAYALATDPDAFNRINYARTFEHAVVEMGRLITRLEAAPTGSAPAAVPVSRAKPPISPVGSSPVVSDPDPDSLSLEEFVRIENEKERARRRR